MNWVQCCVCGHKLLALDTKAGDAAGFTIKCSSCKVLLKVDVCGPGATVVRIGGTSRFEKNRR